MALPSITEHVRPILGAIRTVPISPHAAEGGKPPRPEPFVTLSREAGAGARPLAQKLVDSLNASLGPDERPWTVWDRAMVSQVADDKHTAGELIDSLEEVSHSWLQDFLTSLAYNDKDAADEGQRYYRMAATIRALAQAGRVVILGAGGVFVTRRMARGIHVRLVAPLDYRIRNLAASLNLPEKAAAARVKELEYNRQVFFRRYFPSESLGSENFAVTFNVAMLDSATIIDALTSLIRHAVPAAK